MSNTTPSVADALLQLIESYVEKRHTHGAPQYNVVTARARDAVLAAISAAQAVPDTREMFNAGWCAAARFCDREDAVYDGLVGPGGCSAFEVAYRAALSAAQDAPAGPTRQQIIDWLDALDIEVTDKQLAGLFDVVAMETTQDAPACLSKPGDSEEQSALPLADERQLAAQAVPQGWKLVPVEPTEEMFVDGMEADCTGRPSIDDDRHVRGIWAAMLAAAPAAPHPAAPVHPGDDAMFELWWADHMPNASQAAAWAEWCSLRANQPEPQPAAQQGEIAWPAIPATVRMDVTMLAGYAEGSKSAEIVNTVRRVIDWLNADRIAAQAQEAAPAAQGEPSDTERLDWLATHAKRWWHSGDGYYLQELRFRWGDSLIRRTLREAVDDARAAQQKGASNG